MSVFIVVKPGIDTSPVVSLIMSSLFKYTSSKSPAAILACIASALACAVDLTDC